MRVYNVFHDVHLQAGGRLTLSEEESRHLVKVKRVEAGSMCVVFNGRGQKATARIADANAKGTLAEIVEVTEEPAPPQVFELAPSLTKTDAFEELLNRAIELGVTRIRPIETEHTVVKLDERRREKRRERWNRLAVERIKQCERLWLPDIDDPLPLSQVLGGLQEQQTTPVALMERSPAAKDLVTVLANNSDKGGVCFVIGPEGGWSESEREKLSAPPVVQASLGNSILRSETAALAAAAVAIAFFNQGKLE